MGGYSSFPICIAASILRIKFVIYENNLILGKANKFLLPFANKILVSYTELEGVPNKYHYKIFAIGNIIKKEIINYPKQMNNKLENSKINILILGGSKLQKYLQKHCQIFLKNVQIVVFLLKFFNNVCQIKITILNFFMKSQILTMKYLILVKIWLNISQKLI